MKIISLSQVDKNAVRMEGADKAWKQVPLGREDGVPVYSYRVFTVEPGGHTPYHQHPYEHMNYIIQGRGALVNERGEEQPIRSGDFALVLPDEKHQYRNKGDQPLILICGVPKEFE
jgi:quercetin dioxygenase-like cupin family protein